MSKIKWPKEVTIVTAGDMSTQWVDERGRHCAGGWAEADGFDPCNNHRFMDAYRKANKLTGHNNMVVHSDSLVEDRQRPEAAACINRTNAALGYDIPKKYLTAAGCK